MDPRLASRFKRFEFLTLGARQAMAVTALFEVGVYRELHRGPATAAELAGRTKTDARRLRQFLDAAAFDGSLEKDGDRYRIAAGDEPLFDPDGPHVKGMGLGGWDEAFRRYARAAEVLRGGTAGDDVSAGAWGDAAAHGKFLRYLHARSTAVAAEVGALLSREPIERFADLGCGAGTYAVEVLKRAPSARGVLVELETALPTIREHVDAAGVGERADPRAADFFAQEWGDGYDLILASNLLHCFGPQKNRALVARAAARLRPGGRLAIKDLSVDEDRTGPRAGIWFAVQIAMASSEADVYTEGEISAWLTEAGLVHDITFALRESPESFLLVARRPG